MWGWNGVWGRGVVCMCGERCWYAYVGGMVRGERGDGVHVWGWDGVWGEVLVCGGGMVCVGREVMVCMCVCIYSCQLC